MSDFQPIDALISMLVIAGQLCIARRHKLGWVIWAVSNILLIGVAWQLHRYAQIPGYGVMTFFNGVGYRLWSHQVDPLSGVTAAGTHPASATDSSPVSKGGHE